MTQRPASHAPVAVVHDRLRPEERMIFAAFERAGVTPERIYAPSWRWEAGARRHEGQVVLLRTLSHARTLAVARALEADGAQVVNAAAVVETCGDKAATSAALAAADVPQPRTFVAFGAEEVLAVCDTLGWPVVIKPVVGSWGRMVARCRDADAVEALLEHKQVLGGPSHQVFYVQEHIDKPGRDLRAFVVGDRVVAAIAREGDDWRTNTARGAVVSGVDPSELASVALAAACAVGGGILAVDLLESDRGLLVSEINHGMEFRNSTEPTGVDIPAEIVAHVVGLAEARAAGRTVAPTPADATLAAVS